MGAGGRENSRARQTKLTASGQANSQAGISSESAGLGRTRATCGRRRAAAIGSTSRAKNLRATGKKGRGRADRKIGDAISIFCRRRTCRVGSRAAVSATSVSCRARRRRASAAPYARAQTASARAKTAANRGAGV